MSLNKFSIEMEVRDNELDAQGIVNNSNYMVYLSHARHKHGEAINIIHTDFAQKNMNLIITSCTIKFKSPLEANNKFIVSSKITEADLPFHWAHTQDIKRLSDGKIILKAIFNATCLNKNIQQGSKLIIPEQIAKLIK